MVDPNDKKSEKSAWQWSLEDRLAARFDPEAMKFRATKHAAEQKAIFDKFPAIRTGGLGTMSPGTDTIEGTKSPQLFLPTELFSILLNDGFPPNGIRQDESRRNIEERATALGFGHDFWARLERVAAPILKLERERELTLGDRRGVNQERLGIGSQSIVFCRARAQALEAAKSEFGAEPFSRLLYEVVAPTTSITYVLKDGLADDMRYLEGGCR